MSRYAITRLKAARNAWYWAVHFRRRGKLYYRRFYDLKHGGSRRAVAAAVAWRDERISKERVLTMREFHQQKRANNTSGVPGVHFLRPANQPDGIWQAKIKLPSGRKIHKTFSIHKFGPKAAFQRAVSARDELLGLLDDRPYLKHRTARRLAPASRDAKRA